MGFGTTKKKKKLSKATKDGAHIAPRLQSFSHFFTSLLGPSNCHDIDLDVYRCCSDITMAFISDYMCVVVLADWRGS